MQAFGQAVFHLTEALKRTSGPLPASWNEVRQTYASARSPSDADTRFTPQQIEANNQALIADLDAANHEDVKPSDLNSCPSPPRIGTTLPASLRLIILREQKRGGRILIAMISAPASWTGLSTWRPPRTVILPDGRTTRGSPPGRSADGQVVLRALG